MNNDSDAVQRSISSSQLSQPPFDSTPSRKVGLVLGVIGIASFSLTLPMSRIAVAELDPTFIACGRAIVAALLASVVLLWTRSKLPQGRQWMRLLTTACGVVIGFPLCSTWAMKFVPAAHGAVIVGLLPLATALFAMLLIGERPRPLFWISTVVGSAAIVAFSFWSARGGFEAADLLLVGAVFAASFGYAEGARLSKELGSWQTISWVLLVAAPLMALPAWLTMPTSFSALRIATLMSFAYVSTVSMYLGFFAWYRALAIGGAARIGQLQLLQPMMTMVGATLILSEPIQLSQCVVAAVVLVCVVAGRRAVPL